MVDPSILPEEPEDDVDVDVDVDVDPGGQPVRSGFMPLTPDLMPPETGIRVPTIQQTVQPSTLPDRTQLFAQRVATLPHVEHARALEEFYAGGGTRADLFKTKVEGDWWAPSIGAARTLTGLFSNEEKSSFWTEDLYRELQVARHSNERAHEILDTNDEAHARKLVADYARLDLHRKLWSIDSQQAMGSFGAGAFEFIAAMTDPGMWITGIGAGALTMRSLKTIQTTSKLASAAAGAGIMGSVEALTGYAYGKLGQSGNPMLSNKDVANMAIWGGVFGAGIGGIGGIFRASRHAAHLNAIKGVRMEHSNNVFRKFGPKIWQVFDNIINETPEQRVAIRETLDNLRKVAASGGQLRNVRGQFAGNLQPLTGLIDELSPKDLLKFLDDTSTALELRQFERLAESALRKANAEDILSISQRELGELSKNADISGETLDSLLAAQAKLLKETDRVGAAAINRVLEGEQLLLDNAEIKWLAENRPEVFGKDGINMDELLKGRRLDAKKLRKTIAENTEKLAKERELLARKEFEVGDVVMTEDGNVGRIASVGEDGNIKLESLAVSETRRTVTTKEAEIKKLEADIASGKGSPMHLKNAQKKLEEASNELKKLLDELDEVARGDIFEAPSSVTARFLIAEEVGLTTKSKWAKILDEDRYKSKGKKAGPFKRMTGVVFGERVTITSTLSAGKDLPKLSHDERIWTLTFGGKSGKDFTVHSEGWWNARLASGEIKVTDVEYRTRIRLEDGGTQKSVKEQIERIVRKEVLDRYEQRVLAANRARHLQLSSKSDPKNILDELAEGRVPPEIKEALGDAFSEEALQKWARRELEGRSPEELDKLMHGEAVSPLSVAEPAGGTAVGETLDIMDPDAPELDPLSAYMTGRLVGLGSHNTWGLTHEVGAIRRMWSLMYGSWIGLTDPLTGKAVRAGGAADSIFAGGAMNFRKMEVKARMAPYVEVMLEVVDEYKRMSNYHWWQLNKLGDAEDEVAKLAKRYIEEPDFKFDGVPEEMIPGIKRVGDQFRKSVADILDWAKKNGIDDLIDVQPNKFYYPRYRNHAMMERLVTIAGDGEIDDVLTRALTRANAGMSDDAAQLIAMKLRRFYLEPSGGRALNDNILGVRNQNLKEFIDSLDTAFKREGEDVLNASQRKILEDGWGEGFETSKHARYRIELDMGTLTRAEVDGRRVPVSELFETNTTAVLERYLIDLVSTAQERSLVKMFTTDTYKPRNFDDLMEALKERIGKMGISRGQVSDHLDLFTKFMRNTPRFTRGRLSAGASVLRQWATILKLPGFVTAQVPEAITAEFSTGFWHKVTRRMPIINKLLDNSRLGRIDAESAKKFLHFDLGMGNIEHDLALLYSHHEMIEEGSTLVTGKKLGRMYGYQSLLIPRISKFSWFRGINVYSDLVAHRNFCDLLVEASRTGNRTVFNAKRLASYGVTADDFDEILEGLKKEGVITTESIKGTNIYSLNSDKMTPSTARKFRTMAGANIRQVVQRSHSWDMPLGVATSEWGEFLMQFRTFSMSAMNNHFARNMSNIDKFAFSQVTSMFVGGIAVQFGLNHLYFGDDPQRLKESMEPLNLVRGALIRSGFMGMIPDIVDAPTSLLTGHTIFSPSNKAMLLSIPAFDMVRDYANASKTLFKQAMGQPTRGAENYVYRKITPLTNLIYWRILNDALLPDDLPVISKF